MTADVIDNLSFTIGACCDMNEEKPIEERSLRVPIRCPICGYLMKGKSTRTWYDCGTCISCYIEFVESREDRWKSGWRPTEEQVSKYLTTVREE